MRLSNLVSAFEKRVPRTWAEPWDNPGLSVGDPCAEITRAALALDVTEDTVAKAAAHDCQILITHHPILFHPMKNLVFHMPGPKAIGLAVRKGVALYAAHTNWDSSPEGVNFCLARALGLTEIEPLVLPERANGAWGLGAIGNFSAATSLAPCMQQIRERWRLSACTGFGDESAEIRRVAVGGGACGDFWPQAIEMGAELFVTSDIAYHHRNDARSMGLSLVQCDHGEMERVSLPALKALIEEETGIGTVLLREEPAHGIVI
jgi:dinuclear metal center YbgI/SA1388 family protein